MNRALVSIAAILLLACSSSSSGGDGGSSGGACPAFSDLCGKVPLSTYVSSCGGTSTSALSEDHAPQSADDLQVSSCKYSSSPTNQTGNVVRVCYPSASLAASVFQADHDATPVPGQTQVDVTGVGEKAFYQENLGIDDAELHVLKGNLILVVGDNEASTSKKDCMIAIANDVLAAK